MAITVSNLKLTASSAIAASSSQPTAAQPALAITLTNIDEKVSSNLIIYSRNTSRCYDILKNAYPELILGLAYRGIESTKPLVLTYIGKGSIRALLRSMLAKPHATVEKQLFHMSDEMCGRIQALLADPILQPHISVASDTSPPASMPSTSSDIAPHPCYERIGTAVPSLSRPNYQPLNHSLMGASLNATAKQTILHQDGRKHVYVVTSRISARRGMSDLIASLAELAHLLSRGLTPRTTVFQDSNGHRCAVGSEFNPNAMALHKHLELMTREEKRVFIKSHAEDLGECLALMLYLDQADFHLHNIMYDSVRNRLFIIDFDRCYNKRTKKYRDFFKVADDDFALISIRDIHSPLNPIDRKAANWFTRSQAYIKTFHIHTLEKLDMLPGLDEVVTSADFNLSYFSTLYTCASLESIHIRACTRHIANATLRQRMVDDFSARSAQLRQHLFSMPAFIACYQDNTGVFNARLADLQAAGLPAIAPLTTGQIRHTFYLTLDETINQFQHFEHLDKNLKSVYRRLRNAIDDSDNISQQLDTLNKKLNDQKNSRPILKEIDGCKKNNQRMIESIKQLEYELIRYYLTITRDIAYIDALIKWVDNEEDFSEPRVNKLKSYKKMACVALNKCTADLNAYTQKNKRKLAVDAIPSDHLLDMPKIINNKKNIDRFISTSNNALDNLKEKLDNSSMRDNESKKCYIDRLFQTIDEEIEIIELSWGNSFNDFKNMEVSQNPYLIEASSYFKLLSSKCMAIIENLISKIKANSIFINDTSYSSQSIRIINLHITVNCQFEYLITLLEILRNTNLLSMSDFSQANRQCNEEISHLLRLKNDMLFHNGQKDYIKVCFETIRHFFSIIEPASDGQLSLTEINRIISACIYALGHLDIPLQPILIGREEEQKECGRLLSEYAAQRQPSFLDQCLMLINNLCNHMENHPIAIPSLPRFPNPSNMEGYVQQYSKARAALVDYSFSLQQLDSFLKKLYLFRLITLEYYCSQQTCLALLILANNDVRQTLDNNDKTARLNLNKFKQIYDKANSWYTGIASDKRPDHMETQYQYFHAKIGAWEMWQQIRSEGLYAAVNPSWTSQVVSFFYHSTRDQRTQTFYSSFPEDASAAWQPPSYD